MGQVLVSVRDVERAEKMGKPLMVRLNHWGVKDRVEQYRIVEFKPL